jgi:uncharacterized protein (TIGR03118 family)
MIKHIIRHLGPTAIIALTVIAATAVHADDHGKANRYVVTNLVSNQANKAPTIDANLQNAWGVAFSPAASPFWIADNNAGVSTLYDGLGKIVNLANGASPVKIPGPGGPGTGTPTGVVWNPSAAFLVPGTSIQAAFIFDTEDGIIAAWAGGLTPNNEAVQAANPPNAVYKGLAFGTNSAGAFLFATNFHDGTVDVFAPNGSAGYKRLVPPDIIEGAFTDPNIPKDYSPFGIQNINGNLIVTYAKQDAQKHDDAAGPGRGFVDAFDTDGNLLRRLASRGALNSPWGVARASFAFGKFSDEILIGNFGDGRINAVTDHADREHSLETLRDATGKPIKIDGLWTLTLGGGRGSSPSTLYFTAGPNDEKDGLFGTITPVSNGDDD